MSTEAAVTQSVPSLLYAQQPRPMDSEADAPIRRFEDEKRLIKDAEGILQQFIDQNLLIPEEYDDPRKKSFNLNPIYIALNSSLQTIDTKLGVPKWEDYIPAADSTPLGPASANREPNLTEVRDLIRNEDNPSPRYGGEATNLALVIDPKCTPATYYPYDAKTRQDKMYVRASYITTTELVFAWFLQKGNNAPVILSGTAGTGKSMFANVFLWRLLQMPKFSIEDSMERLDLQKESKTSTGNSITSDDTVDNPYKKHPVVMCKIPDNGGFFYAAGRIFSCPEIEKITSRPTLLNQIVKASGQRAWLITDTNPVKHSLIRPSVNQIFIASTGATLLERNKNFTRLSELRLITRIWSKSEIDELFNLNYADERLVTREKVNQLYRICGGIPRAIFDDAKEFSMDETGNLKLSSRFTNALDRADWEKVFNTISRIGRETFDHDSISSIIFHKVPQPIPRELYGQSLEQRAIIKWASTWMASEAVRRLKEHGEIKSALFLLSGDADYRSAALVGHVFEGLSLSILTRNAQPMRCRLRLLSERSDLVDYKQRAVDLKKYLLLHGFTSVTRVPKPSSANFFEHGRFKRITRVAAKRVSQALHTEYLEDEVYVTFPALRLRRFHDNSDLTPFTVSSNPSSSKPDTSRKPPYPLWVPHKKNYEGIDAIIPNQATFLQMTISDTHPVSVNNINDLKFRKIFPEGEMEQAILMLFVVPKNTFRTFTKAQALKNLAAKEKSDAKLWIHQAVVEVDLDNEYGIV